MYVDGATSWLAKDNPLLMGTHDLLGQHIDNSALVFLTDHMLIQGTHIEDFDMENAPLEIQEPYYDQLRREG